MKKSESENSKNKIKRMTIRLTQEEYNQILADANRANLSLAEFVRKQLNKGKVIAKYEVVTDKESKARLAEEYHKIGINLNQIAHHLNSCGAINKTLISSIENCVSGLAKLRRDLH